MKKILSIILGAFLCIQAFAQINVNAGYLNTIYRTSDGFSLSVKGNGFYAGVSTEFDLEKYPNLTFEPGINFNLSTYSVGLFGISSTEYFLSVPLHIKYNYPINNEIGVFVSAGPTPLCTLGGNSKMSLEGVNYKEGISGGDFDVALGFECGAQVYDNIRLVFGYDFGLLNQSTSDDTRATRNLLHLGVGYAF